MMIDSHRFRLSLYYEFLYEASLTGRIDRSWPRLPALYFREASFRDENASQS